MRISTSLSLTSLVMRRRGERVNSNLNGGGSCAKLRKERAVAAAAQHAVDVEREAAATDAAGSVTRLAVVLGLRAYSAKAQ